MPSGLAWSDSLLGFALRRSLDGVSRVGRCQPIAIVSDDDLPVVVVNEVVAVPAHQHQVVETRLAAVLPGCDVVGLAFTGRLTAADALPVAGSQCSTLCRRRCSACNGFIQRRQLLAENLDPDIGVASHASQGVGRNRAGTANLGHATRLACDDREVGANDDLRGRRFAVNDWRQLSMDGSLGAIRTFRLTGAASLGRIVLWDAARVGGRPVVGQRAAQFCCRAASLHRACRLNAVGNSVKPRADPRRRCPRRTSGEKRVERIGHALVTGPCGICGRRTFTGRTAVRSSVID